MGKQEFPRQTKQIRNFYRGYREIKSSQTEYKISPIFSGILHGLVTLIPEEVEASGILHDTDRRKLVDGLLYYQVALNDRIDFEHSGRTDIADLVDYCRSRESETRARLDHRLETMSVKMREIVNAAINEVEVVEDHIARQKGTTTFDDIEKYRSLVNAISNCVVTSIILGDEVLIQRLAPLPQEKMDWQNIFDKYQWINGVDYRNNTERVVQIMHNLGMAGQIDDDWYGRHIDRTLGIESFASAAINDYHQDVAEAKKFLDEVKSVYIQKAKDLGLSSVGANAIVNVQEHFQKLASRLTGTARYTDNPRIRKFLASKVVPRLSLREKEFAKGRL